MTGSITQLVRTLVAVGATPEMILAAVATAEASKDAALEASREKARARFHKWKSNKPAANVSKRSQTLANDSKQLTRGEDSSSKKHITEERKKEDASPAAQPKKGARIPDDFSPDIEWAVAEGLTLSEARVESAQFLDFWRGKPGKDGLKLDWPGTWRMWVRNTIKRRKASATSPPHGKRTYADVAMDRAKANGSAGIFGNNRDVELIPPGRRESRPDDGNLRGGIGLRVVGSDR